MKEQKNILILFGGGGNEHEISSVSKNYLVEQLKSDSFNLIIVEILKDKKWIYQGNEVCLNSNKELHNGNIKLRIDYSIPCIHGYPGETGNLQAMFELFGMPYLGNTYLGSMLCFNKLTTKLWLDHLNIPTVPFISLSYKNQQNIDKAQKFLEKNSDVFIKASSEGSSVGCYPACNKSELLQAINNAFQFSDQVLVEKRITGRELEISTYEYEGEIHATAPGEIICPQGFYDFDEKYNPKSKTSTLIQASNLPQTTIKKMQSYCIEIFKNLRLRHLARIDFFLDGENIYINEINTFPGMTPISLFPQMLKEHGHDFKKFLIEKIEQDTRAK